jgi:hypothetical protein
MSRTIEHAQLETLSRIARSLRSGESEAVEFSRAVAAARELLTALPPAYERAINNVVTRLESSSLFGGESCSFSHNDLYDALDTWLVKARERLHQP